MTTDVVALVKTMPDVRSIVAGMVAAGEDLGVRQTAEGAVVQLCDAAGRPLVSVEVPIFVQVPGEVERLLGPEAAGRVTVPLWWVEARAVGRGPAGEMARAFADELVRRLGGTVWTARRGEHP
ncbi:hypothetical protein [Actinoallomurus iriomotensis]|uniref:Uncharacterized protein n=1 Tax=Actinoallomurus iriomotensis TaxID=478107 RepID=A0A9W6SFX3_9ACTN|nr:hypothetical protein [Actinoallomurus iriomotensis]GLY92140.1 hypothetical protein Airi02_100680 [Actinoallomurus iriomotensis]